MRDENNANHTKAEKNIHIKDKIYKISGSKTIPFDRLSFGTAIAIKNPIKGIINKYFWHVIKSCTAGVYRILDWIIAFSIVESQK